MIINVWRICDGYDKLVNAFKQCKIANFSRLIPINLLIHSVPKIPVLIMPTCDRFSQELVCSQWCQLCQLLKQFLEPVLGPLMGNSSDGDSRRKLMLQSAEGNTNSEFRPIQTWDSFSTLLGRTVLMSELDTWFVIYVTRMRYTITKSVSILWTMQPGFFTSGKITWPI